MAYKCYGCGARVGYADDDDDDDNTYECCDSMDLVLLERVVNAKKHWARARIKLKCLSALRVSMLERMLEAKYMPGGSGAKQAAVSFESAVKKQRVS